MLNVPGDRLSSQEENELKEIMLEYCTNVTVRHGLKYEGNVNSELFTAWIGCVR